jgi:hypothetical protein
MMKTSQRIAVTAMASVFEEAGVSWRTQRGGKHLCVVAVDPAGHEHKLTVAGSPRADAQAQENWARQDAQRLVRQMGLGEQRPAERRKVKARHRRRDPIERTRFTWEAPDPDEGPLRDPWEALKGLRFAEPIQVEPPRPAPAPTFWSRIAAFFRFQSA